MVNVNNLCTFTGKIAKEPNISTVKYGSNNITKALFTIVVERKLTKEQRQAKQNGDTELVTADFPTFVAYGAIADVIKNYFTKGKPIKVLASYQTYVTKDENGKADYKGIFRVEDISFVPNDTTASNGNNKNATASTKGNKKMSNSTKYNNDDFMPIDDEDIPF